MSTATRDIDVRGGTLRSHAARGTIVNTAFTAGLATLTLFRGLGPADLDRQAVHPERGPETLASIIRLLAGHDLNHLAQLERL